MGDSCAGFSVSRNQCFFAAGSGQEGVGGGDGVRAKLDTDRLLGGLTGQVLLADDLGACAPYFSLLQVSALFGNPIQYR